MKTMALVLALLVANAHSSCTSGADCTGTRATTCCAPAGSTLGTCRRSCATGEVALVATTATTTTTPFPQPTPAPLGLYAQATLASGAAPSSALPACPCEEAGQPCTASVTCSGYTLECVGGVFQRQVAGRVLGGATFTVPPSYECQCPAPGTVCTTQGPLACRRAGALLVCAE